MEMFNKKKNRMERNAVFKKIFRMEDNPNKNYLAAKAELPNVLKAMEKPKHKNRREIVWFFGKRLYEIGVQWL